MFKITKSDGTIAFAAQPQDFAAPDPELISHFCRFESWTADLSTGVFRLGPAAQHHHGLDGNSNIGLLNLVQCYDAEHRQHVLELFEKAAMTASSFCFSTTIVLDDESHVPVMCIGESSNFSNIEHGTIEGVFVFARFKIEQTLGAFS
ncbi:hypothetical protein [Hoeflea sp.]|uniref:hypothetical protein n=1 Tax=Hoeflea sp. TaxID=1940281 RepID=UPI003749FDEB